MRTTSRWVIALLAAAAIVGLLVWARGDVHHRGDDVGTFGIGGTAVRL